MLNHAFLIMVHDCPELLNRIIKNLDTPNHYFFVHVDKNIDVQPFIIGGGNITYIDRVHVTHGGFSQIMTEIRLLTEAFNHNIHIDYFHLISGHDYPCRDVKTFNSFFETNEGRSYMHYDTDEQHLKFEDKINNRYQLWYLDELCWNKIKSKLARVFLNHFFPKNPPLKLFGGWNWFSWHRQVVKYVLQQIDEHPTYLESFRYTTCCDEVIFHTMLHNHAQTLNIERNDSLRYIDWFPTREYTSLPLILDERDYDNIAKSNAFFCRKVDLKISENLLTMLDNDICKHLKE